MNDTADKTELQIMREMLEETRAELRAMREILSTVFIEADHLTKATGIPHTEIMKMSGHTQFRTFARYVNLIDSTIQNASNVMSKFLQENQS